MTYNHPATALQQTTYGKCASKSPRLGEGILPPTSAPAAQRSSQELTLCTLWVESSSPFGGCSGIGPLILGCGLGGLSLWEGSCSASGVDL